MPNHRLKIFFDLEATGPEARVARITQLGAVATLDGTEIGNYCSYVNPIIEVSPKARELTGLSLEFLKNKPAIDQVLRSFLGWIRAIRHKQKGPLPTCLLVAHSGNLFDFPLLFAEMHRCRMDPSAILSKFGILATLDSFYWAKYGMHRSSLPLSKNGTPSLSLKSLYMHNVPQVHRIGGGREHNALYDSYMLMQTCRACGIESETCSARHIPIAKQISKWRQKFNLCVA